MPNPPVTEPPSTASGDRAARSVLWGQPLALLPLFGFFAIMSFVQAKGANEADGWRYLLNARHLLDGYFAGPDTLMFWNGPGYPLFLLPFVALGIPMALARLANAVFLYLAVDLQGEAGNGIAATEVRNLPSFDRVRLEAPVHVVVKSGPSYSAYVTSDANLTGFIQTDAFAGTLTIGMSSGISPTIEPEITIVVPDLHELTHNGNGLVEIQEGGHFPDVSLTLNGGGEIRYSGTASRIHATLNGSGNIVMEGYTTLLEADLRGVGEIHGENLLSGDADVDLSGSGFVFLDLDYQSVLNLNLTGSGHVEWWGSPSRLNYNLLGEGKVVEHRGLPKKSAAAKASAGLAKASGTSTGAVRPTTAQGYETVPVLPRKTFPFSQAAGKR